MFWYPRVVIVLQMHYIGQHHERAESNKDHYTLFTFLDVSPGNRVLLETLTVSQLVNTSPHLMETEGSLQHTQKPAACSYPELDQSSPAFIPFLGYPF
jgi:hypothetical protein